MEKRGSGVTVSSFFLQNKKNAKSNAESVETVATKKNVDRKKLLGIPVLEFQNGGVGEESVITG